jgi:hypothetical protein
MPPGTPDAANLFSDLTSDNLLALPISFEQKTRSISFFDLKFVSTALSYHIIRLSNLLGLSYKAKFLQRFYSINAKIIWCTLFN